MPAAGPAPSPRETALRRDPSSSAPSVSEEPLSWSTGATAATRSSLERRSSSGEREPGRPGRDLLDVGGQVGEQTGAAQARRHAGRLRPIRRAHSIVPPAQLKGLRRSARARSAARPGEVGDRLREAQHPIVGAAAQPAPRVGVRSSAASAVHDAHSRASAGVISALAAPRAEARSCGARAALDPRSRTAAEASPGAPPISSALGWRNRGEDVDPVGERAAELALVALDRERRAAALGIGLAAPAWARVGGRDEHEAAGKPLPGPGPGDRDRAASRAAPAAPRGCRDGTRRARRERALRGGRGSPRRRGGLPPPTRPAGLIV